MSGGVKSFGSYVFPNGGIVHNFSTNFGDGVVNAVRMPGMHGGFNEDGIGTPPSAIGVVRFRFWLVANTRAQMDALRYAAKAMREMGMDKLVYQKTDLSANLFCMATVHNIQMQEQKGEHTDLWQPVDMIFHVPDPVWLGGAYGGYVFDGSYDFGDALSAGGGGLVQNLSGTTTNLTVTNNGNAMTKARLTIAPDTGQSCANPTVQRIVNGVVVDEVSWTGTLNYGDSLVIDGNRQVIQKNGANALANATYLHPDLIRLAAGSNSIKVLLNASGNAAKAYWIYYDAYR